MTHLAHTADMRLPLLRKTTGNALRITPAQRAIATAMNGVDPESNDVATVRGAHVSERLLHLSAAAALRQALMSRPLTGGRGGSRRRGRDRRAEHATRDAYYLALALAADAEGDSLSLRSIIARDQRTWIEAAALVGRLQVRFLEQVCAQIELTANHLPVAPELSTVTARELVESHTPVTETTTLLPDFTMRDPDEAGESDWLHATSTVVIEGRVGSTVVDAGPSRLPASWSARIAAPITAVAGAGRWPRSVVRDCLWMCEDEVRQWVGSMTRELSGDNDEDLLLRVGPPLRWFLTSPASKAILRCAADLGRGTGDLSATLRADTQQPLRAGAHRHDPAAVNDAAVLAVIDTEERTLSKQVRSTLLKELRNVSGGEQELPPDTVLTEAASFLDVRREEMTLLSAIEPQPLGEMVEVTVNLRVPYWEDVTDVVATWRAGTLTQLTAPLLGWTDQDIITGLEHRLTLRARVHRGVGLRTREGFAVFLNAGTRLVVLGTDVSRQHCTIYLEQPAASSVDDDVDIVSVLHRHCDVA